jgi:RimJ/RimL family protein N-acetyltransferase
MYAIANAPADFSTARLHLRKPRLEDARLIFDTYASDPEIPRFASWKAHANASQTRAFLQSCLTDWSDRTAYPYVIELLSDPAGPVGMIHMHAHPHSMSFGYVIARKFWNNGYASEALCGLVDWSLEQKHIFRASALCDVDNAASARVMEKAGMSFEGILRRYSIHPNISVEPRDCRVYARVT